MEDEHEDEDEMPGKLIQLYCSKLFRCVCFPLHRGSFPVSTFEISSLIRTTRPRVNASPSTPFLLLLVVALLTPIPILSPSLRSDFLFLFALDTASKY